MFKKTVKFLFTPRTDSPTKAYYVGLATGVYLTYMVSTFLYDYNESVRLLDEPTRDLERDELYDAALGNIPSTE